MVQSKAIYNSVQLNFRNSNKAKHTSMRLIPHIYKKLSIAFSAIFFLFNTLHALAQPQPSQQKSGYTLAERQTEEAKIRKRIEEKLDWKNRTPEKLDDVPDANRMLIGGLDESILLRQATGERFGLFEAFDDATNKKIIEMRLHKKNKLTDRFPVYSPEICDKFVDISADQVTSNFVVYTTTCYSRKYGDNSTPYLFDYASRNLYKLAVLDYDPIGNKSPAIKIENGIYKMHWKVRLRGEKKAVSIVRNFKILKNAKGEWEVKELPPIDDEAANITALNKLPPKPEYDLPSFVADWGK